MKRFFLVTYFCNFVSVFCVHVCNFVFYCSCLLASYRKTVATIIVRLTAWSVACSSIMPFSVLSFSKLHFIYK